MRFFIVDAFTDKPFHGNPAGVLLLQEDEDLQDQVMQKLASELRFSETVFVKKRGEDLQFRYFTPVSEIELCGHATIGAFQAMIEAGWVERYGEYKFDTKLGKLNVRVDSGLIMMKQDTPKIREVISSPEELEKIASMLQLKCEDIVNDGGRLSPAVVSTGLWDLLVPVKDIDTLQHMVPDLNAIEDYTRKRGLVSVHVFTFGEREDVLCHARDFAPLYGIPEEAATGTANGALVYYLYHLGLVDANKLHRIRQGESMNRPSEIFAEVYTDETGVSVFVGGYGKVIVSGELKVW